MILELLKKYPHKRWNWYELSKNPKIPLWFIEENPQLRWDWVGVSANPNVTMDDVERLWDKVWNIYAVIKS